jgi:hypothetical protein
MELQWKVHPIKGDFKKSLFLIILIIFISILVFISFDSILLGLLGLFLLVFSMRQFFLPTYYILNQEGVIVRFAGLTTKRKWSYFKRFFVDKNGILLSPFDKKSALENFRGIYLIVPNKGSPTRTEILECFSQHHDVTSGCWVNVDRHG